MVLLQPDGRCRHVSPASLQLLGHAARTPCRGADLRDLVIEDDQHAVSDLLDRLGSGERCATVSHSACSRAGMAVGCGWRAVPGVSRPVPGPCSPCVTSLPASRARRCWRRPTACLRRRASPRIRCHRSGEPRPLHRGRLERELRRARRDGDRAGRGSPPSIDAFGLFVELYGLRCG